MRSRYTPDSGLTVRMGLTVLALGALYVVLILVLVTALDLPWLLAVLLAVAGLVAQYLLAGRVALSAMGAREVTAADAPELHAIVDRICALADMPKPRVAVADTDLPNAFASGRSADSAVVCATTGLMRRLEPRELEAVLAHELSHVAHRDVVVMSVASVVAVAAGLLMRLQMYGGSRRSRESAGMLPVVVVALVVYAVAFLLIRVLSRYRELSADRSAALLTGQPSTLASALTKISGEMGRIPTADLRRAEAYNSLFLVPAFAPGLSLTSLFSTHPSLDARLAQLAEISAQLGKPV
jgi:heat shock protein HtpX